MRFIIICLLFLAGCKEQTHEEWKHETLLDSIVRQALDCSNSGQRAEINIQFSEDRQYIDSQLQCKDIVARDSQPEKKLQPKFLSQSGVPCYDAKDFKGAIPAEYQCVFYTGESKTSSVLKSSSDTEPRAPQSLLHAGSFGLGGK